MEIRKGRPRVEERGTLNIGIVRTWQHGVLLKQVTNEMRVRKHAVQCRCSEAMLMGVLSRSIHFMRRQCLSYHLSRDHARRAVALMREEWTRTQNFRVPACQGVCCGQEHAFSHEPRGPHGRHASGYTIALRQHHRSRQRAARPKESVATCWQVPLTSTALFWRNLLLTRYTWVFCRKR